MKSKDVKKHMNECVAILLACGLPVKQLHAASQQFGGMLSIAGAEEVRPRHARHRPLASAAGFWASGYSRWISKQSGRENMQHKPDIDFCSHVEVWDSCPMCVVWVVGSVWKKCRGTNWKYLNWGWKGGSVWTSGIVVAYKPNILPEMQSFIQKWCIWDKFVPEHLNFVSLDHYRPPLLHPHAHPDQDSSSKGVVGNERKWTGLQVHHLHQDL